MPKHFWLYLLGYHIFYNYAAGGGSAFSEICLKLEIFLLAKKQVGAEVDQAQAMLEVLVEIEASHY